MSARNSRGREDWSQGVRTLQSTPSGIQKLPPSTRVTTRPTTEPRVQSATAGKMASANFALLVDWHARQSVIAVVPLEQPWTSISSTLLAKKLYSK